MNWAADAINVVPTSLSTEMCQGKGTRKGMPLPYNVALQAHWCMGGASPCGCPS